MAKRKSCAVLALLLLGCPAVAQDALKVRGLVLDENGEPIAGAAVAALAWDAFVDTAQLLRDATVRTGADGVFEFALDRNKMGNVVVVAPHRQSIALQAATWMGEDSLDLGAVVLVPGAQLIGRVRGEDGKPIAGARVRIVSSITDVRSYLQRLQAGARSDAQGIFKVQGVPRSGLRVVVEADGCRTVSRLAAQESPLDITLPRAATVRGRVVDDDGKPIAGAHVSCTTAENLQERSSTKTAADGAFALAAPPVPRFRVTASEGKVPYRQFRSDLLHGPAAGIVLRDAAAAAAAEPFVVTVVDAATKAPIRAFRLAALELDPTNAQLALANGRSRLRPYEDKAVVPRNGVDTTKALLVEADGHGFAVVPPPADKPDLVVELGPEAILSGRVVDAATQEPLAGVAVRALPKGRSSGSGGNAKDFGPLTDADGRYTIRGLQPGEYGVQVHGETRPASPVREVTLLAGADNHLDLEAPAELWLELEFTGDAPIPPGCTLRLGGTMSTGSNTGFFQHSVGNSLPRLVQGRRARLGPLASGQQEVSLFVPSRTRATTGTMIELGQFDPTQGPQRVQLPDLHRVILRGTVDLSGGIPSERTAVLAWPAGKRNGMLRWNQTANVAGVDGTGGFALDLPAGDYRLQLADLATGIVFHTEAQDVTASDKAVALHPEAHWLEVRCVPEHDGDPVVLQSFALKITGPADCDLPMFLSGMFGSSRRGNGPTVYSGNVVFEADASPQRWLVPAGTLELSAQQTFEMLKPAARSYRYQAVGSESVTIDKVEQSVTFKIPAPPSDDELRK